MKLNTRFAWYATAIVVVAMLGALSGWYFFVRGQTRAISAADIARGFSANAPTGAPTGSTYQNIAQSASDWTNAPDETAAPSAVHAGTSLWHVDTTPVAGFAFTGAGSSTTLSFVEQATGYVFAAHMAAHTIERRTNTLFPKTYEALFASDGHVLERGVDAAGAVTTFAGAVASTSETASELTGAYLDPDLVAVAASPAQRGIFFLEHNAPGVDGVRESWDGERTTVFSSAIADWRPYLLADGRVVLATKPADGIAGSAYVLSTSGTLTSLVRSVPGLTILPRASSTALLYGASTGAGLALYAEASTTAPATALPIRTVADKCAWVPATGALIAYCGVPTSVPAGNFLEDWYRGAVHTSDTIWRVDAAHGTAELAYTPDQGRSLDVADPVITTDASTTYIAFTDAHDGSLWLLRLDAQQ